MVIDPGHPFWHCDYRKSWTSKTRTFPLKLSQKRQVWTNCARTKDFVRSNFHLRSFSIPLSSFFFVVSWENSPRDFCLFTWKCKQSSRLISCKSWKWIENRNWTFLCRNIRKQMLVCNIFRVGSMKTVPFKSGVWIGGKMFY